MFWYLFSAAQAWGWAPPEWPGAGDSLVAGDKAAALSEPGGGDHRPGQGQITPAQGLVSGQESGDIQRGQDSLW